MKKKRHTTEEMIRTLREANGGKTLEAVCRAANISEQTFYRWRRKYGRMGTADARPLKKLVRRIVHLRPRVSTLRLPEDCCGRAGRRVKTRLPCPPIHHTAGTRIFGSECSSQEPSDPFISWKTRIPSDPTL